VLGWVWVSGGGRVKEGSGCKGGSVCEGARGEKKRAVPHEALMTVLLLLRL
jgi:hypothetical protein